MWPDQVSNQGPPAYESDVLPTALCGPAWNSEFKEKINGIIHFERYSIYYTLLKAFSFTNLYFVYKPSKSGHKPGFTGYITKANL